MSFTSRAVGSVVGRVVGLGGLLLLGGCGRPLPERSSPELVVLSTSPTPVLIDRLGDELAWLDRDRQTVVWYRAGQQLALSPFIFPEAAGMENEHLRAFADGSFALTEDGTIFLYRADGTADFAQLPWHYSMGVDGVSIDDFWCWVGSPKEALPGLAEGVSAACHIVNGQVAECVVPYGRGDFWDGNVALGSDGSVYVGGSSDILVRIADGRAEEIVSDTMGFARFFRHGDTLVALSLESKLFEIRGSEVIPLPAVGQVFDFVGQSDDFYYGTWDSEWGNRDSSCVGYVASDCYQNLVWREQVIWHFDHGTTTEVGHEQCFDSDYETCGQTIDAMALDQGEPILFGHVVRGLGAP
ncbi:MAG TPA: hypothetical protein VLC09_19140 [Polyangiaceae bacterium]|nr:hypothetical protein [Polyangiaceae bacterium]